MSIFCSILISANVCFLSLCATALDSVVSVDENSIVERILETNSVSKTKSIISQLEWDELALDDCINVMDRTQTSFGRWALRLLSWPASDIAEVRLMQSSILRLCNDRSLFTELNSCIELIAQHEKAIIDYYDPHCTLNQQAEDLYYASFLKDNLNNNRLALQVGLWLEGAKVALIGFKNTVGRVMAANCGKFFFQLVSLMDKEEPLNLSHYVLTFPWLYNMTQRYNPHCDVLKNTSLKRLCMHPYSFDVRMQIWLNGSLGDQHSLLYISIKELISFALNKGIINASVKKYLSADKLALGVTLLSFSHSLICDLATIYHMKKTVAHMRKILHIKSDLYNSMRKAAHCLHAIDTLLSIIKSSSVLMQLLHVKGFATGLQRSDALQEMLKLVKKLIARNDTLAYGEMLLLHKKIQALLGELAPILQIVGAIDALVSVVNYLHEQEAKNLPTCFVEFESDKMASLEAYDFWLPILHERPVCNDLTLGYGLANKAIFTGPNGGGKSTIMKSICYAVVLGQAWGFAVASHVKMTPFSCIKTSFCPQEAIGKQLSTFMAEQQRISLLDCAIKQIKQGERLLLAIDEPYRGTIEVESASRICHWADRLAGNDAVSLLLATHLEQPIYLAEKHTSFANYQLSYDQVSPIVFKRTFKLLHGAAEWWFSDKVKRAAFIDSLIAVVN